MPSRKKAKGKARRAAKAEAEAAAKVNEAKESQALAANQLEEASLEAMIKRMGINSSEKCTHHSNTPTSTSQHAKIIEDFIEAFAAAYNSAPEGHMVGAFIAAYEATSEEYSGVYSSKLDVVISFLLCGGTQCILDGVNDTARFNAALACYFEQWIAVNVHKTKAIFSLAKIVELGDADDHTLVAYFRKRISCACLDEKYKEVKSVKRMGFCYNPSCSLPGTKVERGRMFYCTRCGEANYCSSECQKADWKRYRESCDRMAKAKAAFASG